MQGHGTEKLTSNCARRPPRLLLTSAENRCHIVQEHIDPAEVRLRPLAAAIRCWCCVTSKSTASAVSW